MTPGIPPHCEYPGCGEKTGTGRGAYHEKHHIKPRRESGPGSALNLIRLCPEHHALADVEAEGFTRHDLWVITYAREKAKLDEEMQKLFTSANRKWKK